MLIEKQKKVLSRARDLVRFWQKREPPCDGRLRAFIIRLERAVRAVYEEFK